MKAYEANILDFIHTKQGMKSIPGFGDKLTVKDIIPKLKRKRVPNNVVLLREQTKWEAILAEGFNRTYIFIPQNAEAPQRGTSMIELLRVVSPWEAKKMFPTAMEVSYARVEAQKENPATVKSFADLKEVSHVKPSKEKFKFSIRGRHI